MKYLERDLSLFRNQWRKTNLSMLKIFLITLGTISLSIGVLGVFIPGLPTTPFLLITASLYIHSSNSLYSKLINNKVLGVYIRNYSINKGLTKRTKIYSLLLMWIMISISIIFVLQDFYQKILIITIGLIGTIIMGFVLKTVVNKN